MSQMWLRIRPNIPSKRYPTTQCPDKIVNCIGTGRQGWTVFWALHLDTNHEKNNRTRAKETTRDNSVQAGPTPNGCRQLKVQTVTRRFEPNRNKLADLTESDAKARQPPCQAWKMSKPTWNTVFAFLVAAALSVSRKEKQRSSNDSSTSNDKYGYTRCISEISHLCITEWDLSSGLPPKLIADPALFL